MNNDASDYIEAKYFTLVTWYKFFILNNNSIAQTHKRKREILQNEKPKMSQKKMLDWERSWIIISILHEIIGKKHYLLSSKIQSKEEKDTFFDKICPNSF